ncbi:PD-(D/E)XK nuclease family protein [Planctomycetales bacterium ZRK34]|nr:PD-(D/E)XK nuclease family protein [Planctomycetales bacterium ZRK34]
MRNVLDQYDQPENQLTHALMSTLAQDRQLVAPFLRFLGVKSHPSAGQIQLGQQQIPGMPTEDDESESRGIPDGCFFDDNGWCVLLEVKVQAGISVDQLRRHTRTAERHGYEKPTVVLISVDKPKKPASVDFIYKEWREVYTWFSSRSDRHTWARTFVDYLNAYESRMIAKNYGIRGTLTQFDGLKFNKDAPYTYREGKRLIRLLGDALRTHQKLIKIGADSQSKGRTAITGRGRDAVWDFISLRAARHAKQFTDHPHLTMVINRQDAHASITIPNGIKGGVKSRMRSLGLDGFRDLIARIERNTRPILKRSRHATPRLYVLQRHFLSQRSHGIEDARLSTDLRVVVPSTHSKIRQQPEWLNAIYSLLTQKRSNMQMGVQITFSYDCPVIQSKDAVELFADTFVAMHPLLEFVQNNKM